MKFAVVGNSVLDCYLLDLNAWPRKDGERAAISGIEPHTGGNGLNVSLALARLGNPDIDLYTAIGSDANGRVLCDAIDKGKVKLRNAAAGSRLGTTTAFLILRDGKPSFIIYGGCSDQITVSFLEKRFSELAAADHLYINGIGLFAGLDIYGLAKFVGRLRQANPTMRVYLDVAMVTEESARKQKLAARIGRLLEQADFFFPNELEAMQYSAQGGEPTESRLLKAAEIFNRSLRVATLIKRGEQGVVIYPKDEKPFRVPTKPLPLRRVVDATGAGDAWSAGFVSAYVAGKSLIESAKAGHAVARQVVQKRGS